MLVGVAHKILSKQQALTGEQRQLAITLGTSHSRIQMTYLGRELKGPPSGRPPIERFQRP